MQNHDVADSKLASMTSLKLNLLYACISYRQGEEPPTPPAPGKACCCRVCQARLCCEASACKPRPHPHRCSSVAWGLQVSQVAWWMSSPNTLLAFWGQQAILWPSARPRNQTGRQCLDTMDRWEGWGVHLVDTTGKSPQLCPRNI